MNETDADAMFRPEIYGGVRREVTRASTMPPVAYTAPGWYERECETIFFREWLMAARAEEIPEPGDYLRLDIVGEPVLLVRGDDRVIRAMSAACRHRGAEVVTGRGNCRAFTCPYHGWSYGLDGALIGVRGMEEVEDFSLDDFGLMPIRCESWGGFVFINFDPTSRPLLERMGSLPERFAAYPLEDMRTTRVWTRRVEANWKVWVENSRENLHTPIAHRESLRRMRRPPNSTIYQTTGVAGVYQVTSGAISGGLQVPDQHFPFIDGLSEEDRSRTHLIVCYPHFLFNLLPDHMAYHQLFPEGPEHTTVVSGKCFPRVAIGRRDFEEIVRHYYEPLEVFLPEDWAVCEALQRGVRGRLARPGRYSLQEQACHDFANWVLDRVVGRG
jgi:phenylpropionate dioxygenase-like ring-hydroxylating dioxygenase large terminal subunit